VCPGAQPGQREMFFGGRITGRAWQAREKIRKFAAWQVCNNSSCLPESDAKVKNVSMNLLPRLPVLPRPAIRRVVLRGLSEQGSRARWSCRREI
jgi:hypothetical protein